MKRNKLSKNVKSTRRKFLKKIGTTAAVIGATSSFPMPWVRRVDAADHLLIGVPSSLSTPYGVADDQDHLNACFIVFDEVTDSRNPSLISICLKFSKLV